MRRPRPRARFGLILIHSTLVPVISFAMRPTLSYAVLETGASAIFLGVLAAAFAAPALIIALPAGHVIDRIGEIPALAVGATASIVACLMAAFWSDSFALLIVAATLLGAGQLASSIGEQALVANMPSERGADSKFGLYSFAASLGQTAGPLLLLLPGGTNSLPPIELIFYACAGISVLLLTISALVGNSVKLNAVDGVKMIQATKVLLRLPQIPHALVTSAIVIGSIDIFVTYVPALGQDRGYSIALVSAALTARSVMSMFSRLFVSKLIAIAGRRTVLIFSITVSAAALIGVFFPLSAFWLVVISSLYGFAVGTGQPITMAWVSTLTPPESQGLAVSLRLASNKVGQTLLPLALGSLAAVSGAGGVIGATGVVLLSALWSGMALRQDGLTED